MRKKTNKYLICISIVTIFVAIGQTVKYVFLNKSFCVIKNFISIDYTRNTGVAFCIGKGSAHIIIITTIFILTALTIYIIKNISKISRKEEIYLSCILAGGLSNLIDRILNGFVVDYIKIELFSFPVFNFADIVIVVSAILYILSYIKVEKRK